MRRIVIEFKLAIRELAEIVDGGFKLTKEGSNLIYKRFDREIRMLTDSIR